MKLTLLLGVLLVGLLLSMTPCSAKAQLVLNSGDSYTWHFSPNNFGVFLQQGGMPRVPTTGIWITNFESAIWTIEIFEGMTNGTPVETVTNLGVIYYEDDEFPAPSLWNDLEGSVRVSCLSGSMVLNAVFVQKGVVLSMINPFSYVWDDYFASKYLDRPSLALSSLDTAHLQLSWPWYSAHRVPFGGYVVEGADTPLATAWTAVTNGVATNSDWTYSVVVDTRSQPQFFRLRAPASD